MDLNNEIASLKTKMDRMLARQEEISNLLAENNVLLRRNICLFEITHTLFPIESEENLKKLENDLATEKKIELVGTFKRILSGKVQNLERILSKNIIVAFNYDGTKGKESLKCYSNVLMALYDATKEDGITYEAFKKELRYTIHRIKNTFNKAKARRESKENKENEEPKEKETAKENEEPKEKETTKENKVPTELKDKENEKTK